MPMNTQPPRRPVSSTYVRRVREARVYDVAAVTPLDHAPRLSQRLANRVYFKREDLQPVFSFKLRGAYNKIVKLPAASLARGVICSSAGNHAQGVALAARRKGIRAVIVMPTSTPAIKIDAVRALGGEIVLHGQAYDEANEHASRLSAEQQLEFVHPFADPDVIAGQGTIGMELVEQWGEPPEAVFVPVGGGGLIGGIGSYLKDTFPGIRIVGVEPVEAASMHDALKAGAPVTLERVGVFADGAAVRRVSDETFRIAQEVVDEILLVDTDEICAAIKDIFEDSRVIAEPAGALAVAGLKRYAQSGASRDAALIAVVSGANMGFDRLRYVTERADIGEHHEALIAVEIPERRGEFLRFCEILGMRNITEFNYRFAPTDRARIFVGVTTQEGRREARALIEDLTARGFPVLDLSDNELAKLHVRHMVGGRASSLSNELIYRFEFPERPGALLAFLEAIGHQWNISLFHYRNHGSDYGRVLAGVQVPDAEKDDFTQHLDTLGYFYREETDNPAYKLFLGIEA